MAKKLDLKDQRILAELFADARKQNSEIAAALGTSKEVVLYRINRLLEEGVIKRFIPVVDFSALGYSFYRLHIKFGLCTDEQKNEFLEYVKSIKDINWIVNVQGRWDMVLLFRAKSNQEFIEDYNNILNLYGPIIEDRFFTMVNSIYYLMPNYLFESGFEFGQYIWKTGRKMEKPFVLDKNQELILKELFKDGRVQLQTIARNLNISINTVKYHLNILKKEGIILGFRPMMNISKLGYEHFKVNLELNNPSERQKLRTILLNHKNVVYITDSIGEYDMEFEAEFEKTSELLDMVDQIRKIVVVRNYNIIFKNEEILINEIVK